jgi:GT2 family glycosyltransferase
MENDSLLVFITGQTLSMVFMKSLLDVLKEDVMPDGQHRFGLAWAAVMGPYIHDNRNKLQRLFMDQAEEKRDWLFMVDNDMCFTYADVLALYAEADARGPGIYAAAYVLEDGSLVTGRWAEDDPEGAYQKAYRIDWSHPTQMDVVGAGFTLIHRDVFEAMGPDAFTPYVGVMGEDLSLCKRAGNAGFRPWVVPAANPGHFKTLVAYPERQFGNMLGDQVQARKLEGATT